MNRFKEELRRIPIWGWVIAGALYIGFNILLQVLVGTAPDFRAWPAWGKFLFRAFVPLPLAIYALFISYVYVDAKRRAMRHVLWTLLAIFVPNGIGIILYFVLREPLVLPCAACGALTKQGFAFCPKCGGALMPACPACRRAVETDWLNCAYCGGKL